MSARGDAMGAQRRIYMFAAGQSDGKRAMKDELGNKGANLCEMARIGLNVPPGFTITTDTCAQFQEQGCLPPGLMEEVRQAVHEVEKHVDTRFGDPARPLLLSVRSGAAASMPGMMDTVLNLGLSEATLPGLAQRRGQRFAYDCFRRLLQMYGDVVLGMPRASFEACITDIKRARGVKHDVELDASDLKELVQRYKAVYSSAQQRLPDDPWEQLSCSIEAVFRSWNTPRAVKYREVSRITGMRGTAVNIQTMVFGNINEHSGTGVAFTRNPATGERKLFGEFLINAQGEDVVAGVRTPLPIHTLADTFPDIFAELDDTTRKLEAHLQDMQDVEFTVQDGRLFMLQCRNGKRTGAAALQIATDMVQEGLINRQQALSMVQPTHLEQLLHPRFCDEKAYRDAGNVLAKGLAASPGAAVGRLVFTAADAEAWHAKGEAVVLCREETSPEDVGGMHAAQGIVTARGGMTSHAAVVARGWGKPCVCGVEALEVDESKKTVVVRPAGAKAVTLREGDWVSLNGTTGEVIRWMQPVQAPEMVGALAQFMGWVDSTRRLQVFANADTPADAQKARENGAQGVGLCRTEHMFFSTPARIAAVRRMIAAEQLASPEKAAALEELAAYQTADFEGIFRAMDGLPVTIRLLDPPLHEFLPHAGPALQALCKQLAKELNSSQAIVKGRLEALREANPMMGLRGCRLGIIHPEISSMQARAVFQAASHVVMARGRVFPHIMVPLVGSVDELNCQVALIKQAAAQVQAETGVTIPFRVGTMIEVPRAALLAGKLAASAEFFSFGSNDLTQMTFGISRDDAQAKFLSFYITNGILPADPFETLDQEGVGEMIRIAVKRGRAARPDLGLGVCGEHAGDPASIAFFDQVGLDYVSCSPLRVPVARLAAAQAAAGRAGATPQRPAAPAKDPHQAAATNGTKNAAVQLRIDAEGAGIGESRTQHVHTGPSTP